MTQYRDRFLQPIRNRFACFDGAAALPWGIQERSGHKRL